MSTGAVQDVRRRLCSNADDIKVYKCIQEQLQDTEKRLAEGWAVLDYLQDQLTDVACDDPGTAIGAWLALPILQVGCAYLGHMCCGRSDPALP